MSSPLQLIFDSKALSIWNHKTGPVFWYAAGVPGPFYLNTEVMIGNELAESLLQKITAIVAETEDGRERAERLHGLIIDAYRLNSDYCKLIDAMVAKAGKVFGDRYSVISGGERRDWLFSIPLAEEMRLRHLYLFKNQTRFCAEPVRQGERVLHVSDLINNAASYFDLWFPLLDKAGLDCVGTLTVNTRGAAGVRRLEKAGYKVSALNHVDLTFFQKACKDGIIDEDTLDEITIYFTSPQEWATRYLMHDAGLYGIGGLDGKSFERMKKFFDEDPWELRAQHADFFEVMQKKIAARA